MTAPRQIIPGHFYLITRRCAHRQFLLRPSCLTNQIVKYSLALAAGQTGVLLHGVCFMSNHWHGVVTDPEGRLPEFLERFHRLVAKAQNASLGHWENLWSSDKTSAVLLVSDEDVLEKMAGKDRNNNLRRLWIERDFASADVSDNGKRTDGDDRHSNSKHRHKNDGR